MKSSKEELKSRGYLSVTDYKRLLTEGYYSNFLVSDMDSLIPKLKPSERTFVYRLLKERHNIDYLEPLCLNLKIEKKLYCKIELCNSIASYGTMSLKYLDPLLGLIGNNQFKKIGNYDLNKKSYPLPRDIVARTIIRMGSDVLLHYKESLHKYNHTQLSEIIDLIGHITYTTGDQIMANDLIELYRDNKEELIKWKLIKAFRSFNHSTVKNFLISESNNTDPNLAIEAKNSLNKMK